MQTETDNNIEQQVRAITIHVLCLDEVDIRPDARFREELGADSLDLVELIVSFGRRFQIQISDAEVAQIETVGQVAHYIQTKLQLHCGV